MLLESLGVPAVKPFSIILLTCPAYGCSPPSSPVLPQQSLPLISIPLYLVTHHLFIIAASYTPAPLLIFPSEKLLTKVLTALESHDDSTDIAK